MRIFAPASTRFVMAALVCTLAAPAAATGQVRQRGGDDSSTGSQAVPREAPRETPPSAPRAPAAAAPAAEPSGGSRRAPAAEASESQATPRSGARPREGRPTIGTAVPRGSVPRPPRDERPVIVPVYYGSYWPWGFGGLGYGSYYGSYYGGFYDPWHSAYGYPYGGYQYPRSIDNFAGDGELRLKIKPREAQVFIDGYYVGVVDDFDGIFQRMHLDSGPHRVEVRAPGYEPLTFDVQIRFGDTTTYEGELRRIN